VESVTPKKMLRTCEQVMNGAKFNGLNQLNQLTLVKLNIQTKTSSDLETFISTKNQSSTIS
jgi:hypothetical protein